MKRTPLKPGKALERKTPLKRGAALEQKTPLRRDTPIKQRSDKMEQKYKVRRKLVPELLAKRPLCELGPRFRAVDPTYSLCWRVATCCHELVKRSGGGDILDRDNILTSCGPCNTAVEDFPALARKAGLSVRREGDSLGRA